MLPSMAIHPSKAVYTLEKSGTDLSKKEYGPHIFARVNNSYHVLGDGYGPVFFSGFGAIDVYGPKTRKNMGPYSFFNSYVSLRNNFANDMHSKKPCGSGDKNVVGFNMAADSSSAWKNEVVEALKTDLSTVQ